MRGSGTTSTMQVAVYVGGSSKNSYHSQNKSACKKDMNCHVSSKLDRTIALATLYLIQTKWTQLVN
jgi:hypothetical protein